MSNSKSFLRKEILTNLTRLSSPLRKNQTLKLVNRFLNLKCVSQSNSIGITISKFPELDTHLLIQRLWNLHKRIYCPLILPMHKMDFIEINEKTNFIKNKIGIYEPVYQKTLVDNMPEIMVVPGLGYSLVTNQRIGFGEGYYDRFLQNYHGKKIALALPSQIIKNNSWEIEKTDIYLDKIITL